MRVLSSLLLFAVGITVLGCGAGVLVRGDSDLVILGVTSLIPPIAVSPQMVRSDMVWMLALSAVLFPMMRRRFVVSRAEGALLVAAYGTYHTLLVLGG